mmetsp:Transcript_26292/g.75920  ORF Transcript_26292/g.75920 Transcript_26292/m.75920 type:complete len:265 (+) Transcript_26292:144-938(+)|eukprot:CAMPEP_0181057278 /NCGR_PEP_ID=MMETSP1070-20121207/20164_1 /TAXON_ID=265543 /ORGANISM="Minutocellus polymorphus, Strain NH13" /LENGTH=264 /DNA_ID=CAMNT_0023136679 /DNA_START=70 /DNA_END=864 /DNA_ORIENTATION=-
MTYFADAASSCLSPPMSFSSSSTSSSSSCQRRPFSIPIFLVPNTLLANPLAEEEDRIGWESFPPLVESLEDEEQQQEHLRAEVIEACRGGSSSDNNTHRAPKKSVSFSTVAIREHQVIVGDHPCTDDSLPLSLGWAHAEESCVVNIDTYEILRSSHRRCLSDLQLSFLDRKNILKRVGGLSERDIMHERRRAFRESFDDPSSHRRQRLRRVQTVAAMAQTQAAQARARHQEEEAKYLPPAVARAIAINPGCPINIEPRASVISA